MKWSKLYNPIVKTLLRSPLRGLLGKTAVLTIEGRRSGQPISVPVMYIKEGPYLRIISQRSHVWWRNLRGGAPIVLQIDGKEAGGIAEAIEEPDCVAEALESYLTRHPDHARYYHISFDNRGIIRQKDLSRAADSYVIVHVLLKEHERFAR